MSDGEYPQHPAAAGRDEVLGRALRRLDVPEHRPGFHAELRAKLSATRSERDADPQHPARAPRARSRTGRARHPSRWTLGLAAAAAVILVAAVAVALSASAPASAAAVARRAALAARTGTGLPPFELTATTITTPGGFQPEPPPPRVTERIDYAGPSHWRDQSVVTEPFNEGTHAITRIRNGHLIASVAGGQVSVTRATRHEQLPFTVMAWQQAALRKLLAAGSSGRCAPSASLGGDGPVIDGRPTLILRIGRSPCPSADIPQSDGPATFWLDKQTFLVLHAVLHGPRNRIAETIAVTRLRYHVRFTASTFALPKASSPKPPACRAPTSLPDLAALQRAVTRPPLIPGNLPGGLRVGRIDGSLGPGTPGPGSPGSAHCKISAFTITYNDPAGRPAVQLYEAPRTSPAVRFQGRAVTIRPGLTGTITSGSRMVILWWIQDGRYCSLQTGGLTAGVRLTTVPTARLIQIAASVRSTGR
jgi:hypothetical protein